MHNSHIPDALPDPLVGISEFRGLYYYQFEVQRTELLGWIREKV
jgi:hypothetical protein